MVGDMENYKVKVNNWDESKEVQELYIALGATGSVEEITSKWVCSYYKQITFYDLLPNVDFKQVTLQHLRDLVVLKRNDVNDAKYVDSHLFKVYIDSDDKIYYFEHRQFNNGQYHMWVESGINGHRPESLKDEYISKLKPIENEVKMKEKEYIAKVSGDWRLVDSHELVSGRIEVPEGAEIAIESLCKPYFVKLNGETYDEFFCFEWRSGGLTEQSLRKYKKILWQRNLTTNNTSIQDKLKFIEKWLNGEKIQYILGIESEKTQSDKSKWHNFTEGAMQYIKRSDIKFREAPKYVTINGSEFKSVKSLLKYVKNNFDLEDGS